MKSTEVRVASSLSATLPAPRGVKSDVVARDHIEHLARRIRNEYLEMPGLSLTLVQAERMWQLRRSECEDLLGALVATGFLARTAGGAFVRDGSGRSGA